jgi:hypothetical protein
VRIETATCHQHHEGVSTDLTGDVDAFIRATGVRDRLCVMMVDVTTASSRWHRLEDAMDDLRLVRGRMRCTLRRRREPATDADRADIDTSGPAPPDSSSRCRSPCATVSPSWAVESILLVDGRGPRRAVG